MISTPDRQMAVELIDEAMRAGSRQSQACEIVGIHSRTYQRWQADGYVDRRQCVEKQPANRLTE